MNCYNGYSGQERNRKQAAANREFVKGVKDHPCSTPPCMMCGDPDSKVAPHSEDYSKPYFFEPPYEYAVCTMCHSRIHRRFASPASWEAYKMHLRRGGYGSDLKPGSVADMVKKLTRTLEAGSEFALPPLPRDKNLSATEWWEQLSVDPRFIDDPSARPRR